MAAPPPTTHANLLLPLALTVLLTTVTSQPSPEAGPPLKRTFEQCSSTSPCGPPLICRLITSLPFARCPPTEKNDCICLPPDPPGFLPCGRPDACPPGEDCAISRSSRNAFCMGCEFLRKGDNLQTLKDASSKRCNLAPSPKPPAIPPGLAADLCSPTAPCASGYACTNHHDAFCLPADIICHCVPAAGHHACKTPDDCPDGETCAMEVLRNRRVCASCTAVRQDGALVPHVPHVPHVQDETVHPDEMQQPDKCRRVARRVPPVYPPSGNGLSFDACEHDLTCLPPRQCRIDAPGFPACNAVEAGHGHCLCFRSEYTPGMNECRRSADCPLGEVCTRFSDRVQWLCVSKQHVDGLSPDRRRVSGNAALPKPADDRGFSGDACTFDWDCRAPRRCTHSLDDFGGCAGRRGCECKPLSKPPCADDERCQGNEICVNFRGAVSRPFCTSKRLAVRDEDLVRVSNLDKVGPPALFDTNGLTGDRCLSDSDCAFKPFGERVCRHITERSQACNNRASCFCVVPNARDNSCITSADCADGEMCVRVLDATQPRPFCRSAEALAREPRVVFEEIPAPSPSARPSLDVAEEEEEEGVPSEEPTFSEGADSSAEPTEEDEICVDARALAHLAESDLVFPSHRRARVLCDGVGSCATAGHIVVWRDVAMRMQSYCERHASCVRRSMLVNSPRLKHGLRLTSRTDGLEFTAFAARFNTRLEEQVLTRLVHIGL